MTEESKSAVVAAMGANFAIAVGKLGAGLLTGSAALLAEAGHSVADTVNQIFLLVGINLADSEPDASHPHGYGKEAFFWAFLAAIFIFVAGAAFSFYEGGRTMIQNDIHERSSRDLVIAYGVLGMAFLFESISFVVAIRGLWKGARRKGWSIVRYLRKSPDLATKTVFWEDGAALTGLAVAAVGLFLSEATGNEHWDGAASLVIGVVLAMVALILGIQARHLLIGAAAGPETLAGIDGVLARFPEVEAIPRMLTMQIGSSSVLVTGELQISDRLTLSEAERLIERIDSELATEVPEIHDTYWEIKRRPGASAPRNDRNSPRDS
ncbi:MAG: cation diffusion facilitator family transporter [Dehalococcoidia bacterium]